MKFCRIRQYFQAIADVFLNSTQNIDPSCEFIIVFSTAIERKSDVKVVTFSEGTVKSFRNLILKLFLISLNQYLVLYSYFKLQILLLHLVLLLLVCCYMLYIESSNKTFDTTEDS